MTLRVQALTQNEADQLYTDALRAVNRARVALDASPLESLPAGLHEDACRCPIAQAFHGLVTWGSCDEPFVIAEEIEVDDEHTARVIAAAWQTSVRRSKTPGRWLVETPTPVFRFVCAFDHREYPQLILDPRKAAA